MADSSHIVAKEPLSLPCLSAKFTEYDTAKNAKLARLLSFISYLFKDGLTLETKEKFDKGSTCTLYRAHRHPN